jgi:hypothetical protein
MNRFKNHSGIVAGSSSAYLNARRQQSVSSLVSGLAASALSFFSGQASVKMICFFF